MKIIVLEGPDGTGKSTLANEIYNQTKGHILHCTWNKNFNMQQYFIDVMNAAKKLSEYQVVVVDRWAPSELIYGNVFRGGPSFDVMEWIPQFVKPEEVTWVMCVNENAVENHLKNKETREEMFEDMTDVVDGFNDLLMKQDLPWIVYDFNKVDMKKFVEDLVHEG